MVLSGWSTSLNTAIFFELEHNLFIQLESEMLMHLDLEWLKKGWFANGLDLVWDLMFETQTKTSRFCEVQFLNGLEHSFSSTCSHM